MSDSERERKASHPSTSYLEFLRYHRRSFLRVRVTQLALLLGMLILWELAAAWNWVDPMLTSRPSQIWDSFFRMAADGSIFYHSWVTGKETLIGFGISMTLGTFMAIALWWSTFWSDVWDPYIVVCNALPKVALGPIFYIWLGDRLSIYGMAIAISVIVTIIMMESGFKEIARSKMKLMDAFGATRGQKLRMVLLPASVPNLVATMKVNIGLTLVGVIMGEFLSSKAGLGYLILYGGQVFQMDLVMTSIALLAVLSLLFYGMVHLIGRALLQRYHFD